MANPVYTNGQTEETKHVEEASSPVCLDDEELEMFVDHPQQYLSVSLTYFLQKRPVEMCKSESPFIWL